MGATSPVDVVILAAGRSSRMGEPKGLVLVDGRPWIARQLDALGGRRAIVVLGHDRDRYLELLLGLGRSVDLVTNPDPDRGPFSSLQEGLLAVEPGRPAFVLPVDVPAAAPPVWIALETALGEAPGDADAVVPVFEGRGGHPVLLGSAFVGRLLARPDPAAGRLDEELRALAEGGRLARVPVDDPRVRLNLNAPGDWGKVPKGG
jgi:CTP:molybdopterin cytidylyltransferase MocA